MDFDDYAVIGFFLISGIICLLVIFHLSIMTPLRVNNAQSKCESLGFETFVKYDNIMFQVNPVGLVCGSLNDRMIEEGIIKKYVTDSDSPIIVQEVKKSE